MINKVKLLKRVGKFYDYAAKGERLDWHKNTFLFAPNAYGKSTLVNVLRSLWRNDAKIVRARKTANAAPPPEAIIIVDGTNRVFDGAKWDKPYPEMHIFDTSFIHDNIHAHEIEYEHRKNIHRIIIGAQGITLARELAFLKEREKKRRSDVGVLQSQFASARLTHALDAFLAIPAADEATVRDRIKRLERDIVSKESETQVHSIVALQTISLPVFDLVGLRAVALEKIAFVHDDAEKRVVAHIARNFKDRLQAKGFIQQGLDLIQTDCPFCGQNLASAAGLIAAYRQYFDGSFRDYQQRLAKAAESVSKWNLDNALTSLVSGHNANLSTATLWERFIGEAGLPDIVGDVEGCRAKLTGLKEALATELERKQKDPNIDIDLSFLDDLSAEMTTLRGRVNVYNDVIAAFSVRVTEFLANMPKSDLDSLRRAKAKEQEIEKRFLPEWKKWAAEYELARKEANDLLEEKNAKQQELKDYTKAIFESSQKRINELLMSLGADFEIADFTGKTDERASEVYSDLSFLILGTKVPLTARQDDAPSFKNTLSEGDKSALAFAFFVAAVERLPNLDKLSVIFDDPLSSLDENRREATARELMTLSLRCGQLCVLTHKKDFLWMLVDKIPDHSVLRIRSDMKNGSRLEPFDVEQDRKSDHMRRIDDMVRYMEEDFGPTPEVIQGNIRIVFEHVLKTKYYRRLARCIHEKHGLATILKVLFDAGIVRADIEARLFDLCSVANGPHHGEIVDTSPKKLTRGELIPLIREALTLLEKV